MTPEALAAIHARAMRVPGPWSAEDFTGLLATPGTFLVPAPGAHGFALGRTVLDEAELLTLAIDPAQQGKGLGRACLAQFEQAALNSGAVLAHLEVADPNAAARALYYTSGWTVSGTRKGYYRTPTGRVDAVLMKKSLLAA